MLDLQKDTYEKERKFVFFRDMCLLLPKLKEEHPWLTDAPAAALQRVCRNLDLAIKQGIGKDRTKGFPKYKARTGRRSIYYTNQKLWIRAGVVGMLKLGSVKFRCGRRPEGKVMSATVVRQGDDWYCMVQCEVSSDVNPVMPFAETTIGVDVGLTTMMVCSDGVVAETHRPDRRATRRDRLAHKALHRRVAGSKNHEKARRRLAVIRARLARVRSDARHKATRALVDRASVITMESLRPEAIKRAMHLGRSANEAGLGMLMRMVDYKSAWHGRHVVRADRFFPSTQKCSACGIVRTGAERLRLQDRIYTCECGHSQDRDLNAAMNLRRYGIEALGLTTVGQAMPEQAEHSAKACGDISAGARTNHRPGRHVSPKQESPPEIREGRLANDCF